MVRAGRGRTPSLPPPHPVPPVKPVIEESKLFQAGAPTPDDPKTQTSTEVMILLFGGVEVLVDEVRGGTVLTGTAHTPSESGGVQYQRCGGGRRVIRKSNSKAT